MERCLLDLLRMRNALRLIESKEPGSNEEGRLRSHLFQEDSNLLKAIYLFWKFHLSKTNISFQFYNTALRKVKIAKKTPASASA
jgi:hypothetical protein